MDGRFTAGGDEVADGALLARVRAGSDADYGVLFERHRDMALRFARSQLNDSADADDVVAEVFASVLATVKRGGGPMDGFAPYLMTSLRHQCQRVGEQRTQQLALVGQQAVASMAGRVDDVAAGAGEADIVRDAFQSLSPRFQDVLWRVEVDEEPYEDLASRYRTTAGGVAVLILRARRALASAYLDRHRPLPQPGRIAGTTCRAVAPHLTGLVRDTLGRRRRQQVEAHVEQCASCRGTTAELGRINQHLRTLPIAPLALLGDAAAVGTKGAVQSYLATCWTAAAPVLTSGLAAVAVVSPLALAADDGATLVGSPVPAASAAPPDDADADADAAGSDPGAPTTGSTGGASSVAASSTTPPAETASTTTTTAVTATTTVPVGVFAGPAAAVASAAAAASPGGVGTAPGGVGGAAPGVTVPGLTVPGLTTPGVTLPGITVPRVTVPGVTVAVPPITPPPVTVPPVTVPPVTVPPVTAPPVTLPPVTLPPATVPVTTPPVTIPPNLPVTLPPVTLPPVPPL